MGMALGLWSTVTYSPSSCAGRLGGPCRGRLSPFLVRLASGLGEGMRGRVGWRGPRGSRAQPRDFHQISHPPEARLPPKSKGDGVSLAKA